MFSSTVLFWSISTVSTFIVVFLVLIIIALRKAQKKADEDSKSQDGKTDKLLKDKRFDSFLQLRNSFKESSKFLKQRIAGKNYRYQMPWFLMIGESSSGKSTLLEYTGLGMPIGKFEDQEMDEEKGVQWWFFDKGVVVEPKGEFVLKPDGRSSNTGGWQNVIKLLKRYRPNRPIDGVILTIPYADLIQKKGPQSEWKGRLNEKSTILYNKLWELQNELGVHFPIYVLITKCDKMVGFSTYCHELPENLHQNILGWSNPYSLDVSYSSEWVDKAVSDIHAGIFQSQMEVFASKPTIDNGDDLFLLPSKIRELDAPLAVIFNILFKESAFHNKFFFRGIYLTGSSTSKENEIKKPLFTKDLFEKKIFLEDGLAKIVDQAMLSKHRNLRIVQVAFVMIFVIGSGGLTKAFLDLRAEKQTLLPILGLISSSLVDLKYKKTIDRSVFEEKGISLLNGMAKMDPSGLNYFIIPSSWTSNLQSNLVSCMTIAYEKIIMRMMYIELNNRVRSMGFADKKFKEDEDKEGDKSFKLEKTLEFKQLLFFIKSLEELEKNIAIYNKQLVTGSASSREFLQVVDYLYNIDLKGSISAEALAKLQGKPVSTDILMSNVNAKIWELTWAFYSRIYKNNDLNLRLIKLKEILRNIHRDNKSEDEQNIVMKFRNLLGELNEIERNLTEPEFAWMVSRGFELGSKFDQILESVQNSGYLGQTVYIEIKNRGEREHKDLQLDMLSHNTRLTGPLLLNEDGKAILKFSPKITTLKKALEDFFVMKFADIENARNNMLDTLPPNSRVVWNTQLLGQAVNLHDSYTLFLTEKLNDFPIELQPIFQQVAKQSLETNMVDLIGRSQILETIPKIGNPSFNKEMLRSDILNFRESSSHISKLLGIFDSLELHKTNQKLFRVVALQGNRILKEVDDILQEDDLYMVQGEGFSWWNGQKSPVLAAYNVNDVDELKYYFSVQRNRVAFLTNDYASPVIGLLGYQNKHRGYVDLPLVNKWEHIIEAFESFEKKKPGNSIGILEDFILTGINQIAADQCSREIPSMVITARSSDYFLNQRNQLRKKIHLRCQKLSFDKESREY
ncbi:hypothetical protein KKA14_17155 [bacterium]|nr:hypothetical protein [bacterium]